MLFLLRLSAYVWIEKSYIMYFSVALIKHPPYVHPVYIETYSRRYSATIGSANKAMWCTSRNNPALVVRITFRNSHPNYYTRITSARKRTISVSPGPMLLEFDSADKWAPGILSATPVQIS